MQHFTRRVGSTDKLSYYNDWSFLRKSIEFLGHVEYPYYKTRTCTQIYVADFNQILHYATVKATKYSSRVVSCRHTTIPRWRTATILKIAKSLQFIRLTDHHEIRCTQILKFLYSIGGVTQPSGAHVTFLGQGPSPLILNKIELSGAPTTSGAPRH